MLRPVSRAFGKQFIVFFSGLHFMTLSYARITEYIIHLLYTVKRLTHWVRAAGFNYSVFGLSHNHRDGV